MNTCCNTCWDLHFDLIYCQWVCGISFCRGSECQLTWPLTVLWLDGGRPECSLVQAPPLPLSSPGHWVWLQCWRSAWNWYHWCWSLYMDWEGESVNESLWPGWEGTRLIPSYLLVCSASSSWESLLIVISGGSRNLERVVHPLAHDAHPKIFRLPCPLPVMIHVIIVTTDCL